MHINKCSYINYRASINYLKLPNVKNHSKKKKKKKEKKKKMTTLCSSDKYLCTDRRIDSRIFCVAYDPLFFPFFFL